MNFFSWRFGKKDVTACDADTPPISITPNNSAGHTLVNMPTGSGKAVAKGVSQQSLEEHDKRFHHGHYDGGSCKYREQNGIKTGAAGTGGTGTATPTTSPAPSSKPITIQEKSEIREEDTLSKNPEATESKQSWQKNLPKSYQIPDRLQKKFYPWLNSDQSDKKPDESGMEKEDSAMAKGNTNPLEDDGGSNTDPLGRPVDANGNPITREYNNQQRGKGTPGSYVDTGLPWKPKDIVLDPNDLKPKRKDEQTFKVDPKLLKEIEGRFPNAESYREAPPPSDPNNPPPNVIWQPTSFGGGKGYWRYKTEEEMRREVGRHGQLIPRGKPRGIFPGSESSSIQLEPHLPESGRAISTFMDELESENGATDAVVSAAEQAGKTPEQWLRDFMAKEGIRMHYGRFSKKDVQRIIEAARRATSFEVPEFEDLDLDQAREYYKTIGP